MATSSASPLAPPPSPAGPPPLAIRDGAAGAKLALVIVDSKVAGAAAPPDLAVAGAAAADLLLANLVNGTAASPGFRGHVVLGIASLASQAYLAAAVGRARAVEVVSDDRLDEAPRRLALEDLKCEQRRARSG